MGMVFGKTGAAEPAFDVIYRSTSGGARSPTAMHYEIRKYGERFAAETSWITNGNATTDKEDERPFTLLAKYIGVFGTPQNEGQVPISMTAPVMKQQTTSKPVQIAMTAPVMKVTSEDEDKKSMMFVLPDSYTTYESIPKPTNPAVTIVTIPPATGAVYRYSGSMDDGHAHDTALTFGKQLYDDGATSITDSYVDNHYQYWGYTPPFTIPIFRRNEIWIELNEDQINQIVNKGQAPVITAPN